MTEAEANEVTNIVEVFLLMAIRTISSEVDQKINVSVKETYYLIDDHLADNQVLIVFVRYFCEAQIRRCDYNLQRISVQLISNADRLRIGKFLLWLNNNQLEFAGSFK